MLSFHFLLINGSSICIHDFTPCHNSWVFEVTSLALLKKMKALTLRSEQMASSQGQVLRFQMMNSFFFFFLGLLLFIQLSYVLVYKITLPLSFMLFLFVGCTYFSLFFDNICKLLLLLSSLITVNYSPFIRWSFILGVCLWGSGRARWGSASFWAGSMSTSF